MTKKNIAKCSDAAETVLGYFGFDRTLYGDAGRSKKRKWWYQLREQHQIDQRFDLQR